MESRNLSKAGRIFKYTLFSIFISFLFLATGYTGDELIVKIRPFREKNIDYTKEYKYQLLELVLKKTQTTNGPFRIEVAGREIINQSRVFDLIDQGSLTLIMVMTSKERESQLLPVRIPVYKGLFGYRIFIINQRDQNRFEKIKTRGELSSLWAGQGHDWPDLKILESNGFNIVGGSNYRGLFAMLQENRFDYFPRAATEPWREVQEEKGRDLIVESSLLLHYYAPAYMFVAKNNVKLAERLTRGFEKAISDGSFDRFFNNHKYIKDTLGRANLKSRTLFKLQNPLLTPQTPLNRKEFWYTP